MPTEFEAICPPGDAERLRAFEERNALTLPSEYRRFLLRHNGGRPHPALSSVSCLKTEVIVDCLFGLGGHRDLELQTWLDEYETEMPRGYLVIGGDPGGALYILDTSSVTGAVYLWDHQHRYRGSSEANGNTFLLADSFEAWLHSLHDEAGLGA